jgi:hypothetical protein
VAEDGEALRLAPVVDDVGEEVGVAAGGNAFEEAPESMVTRSVRFWEAIKRGQR